MNFVKRFDKIQQTPFDAGGSMNADPVKIVLKEDAILYYVTTAQRAQFPILPKVKEELNRD